MLVSTLRTWAQTIVSPTYSRRDDISLRINEVERTTQYTIIKGVYENVMHYGWACINNTTYLKDSKSGKKYGYKRLKTYDFGFNKKEKIENAYCYGFIEKKKGATDFCVQFDPKQKEIINVVDNNGVLTSYQFDRKEKGDKLKIIKSVSLFEDN